MVSSFTQHCTVVQKRGMPVLTKTRINKMFPLQEAASHIFKKVGESRYFYIKLSFFLPLSLSISLCIILPCFLPSFRILETETNDYFYISRSWNSGSRRILLLQESVVIYIEVTQDLKESIVRVLTPC